MWAFTLWAGPVLYAPNKLNLKSPKYTHFAKCPFSKDFILLFNLFLLLVMSFTVLFSIIYGFHFIILINFNTFKQKF